MSTTFIVVSSVIMALEIAALASLLIYRKRKAEREKTLEKLTVTIDDELLDKINNSYVSSEDVKFVDK